MIDNTEFDHLIPAGQWEKILKERAEWASKSARVDALAESSLVEGETGKPTPNPWHLDAEEARFYHDEPYETGSIKWHSVAAALRAYAESHPGAWVRIRANAETSGAVATARWGGLSALEGLEVESFHRHARPRSDGQPTGFEIYLRARL